MAFKNKKSACRAGTSILKGLAWGKAEMRE
jgi:hypothetical protein